MGPAIIDAASKLPDQEHRLLFLWKKFAMIQEVCKTYTEVPVGPREFVESPNYLNEPTGLWPEVMEYFCELNNGNYDVAVLTGGIGVAKTTIAVFTQLYQLYLLSIMREPHRTFNLLPSDEIVVIFQSIKKELAKSVDYARFQELIRKSPYFQRNFAPDPTLKAELHFPRRIIVKPVSGSSTAAIGQNVIAGLIDEVNFMAVVKNSLKAKGGDGGVYDQAEELWNAIERRRESRFMLPDGRYPGLFCLISSKQYPGEFTDRMIDRARRDIERDGETHIYVYDKRRWEVKPDQFKDAKWFRVFIGDETRKPRILEDGDVLPREDAHLVLEVPMAYYKTFENNLLDALRDVGGVSTQALHPFIPNINKMSQAFKDDVDSVLSRDYCDFVKTKIAIDPDAITNPDEPRFVHIDLAISNDSAGVACGYIEKFVEVEHGDEIETMPVIRFDYVLEIKPPPNDEIQFEKIRDLLYKQRDLGMNIKWVTLDSFQSRDTMQLLRQRGFVTGMQSMDTDLRPYQFLKSALMDGRVICPMHSLARSELARLEWHADKKKIDHPPTGSKDVSDCMAGVAFGLTMRLEIWNRHKVRTRLPKRLVAEARGKNDVVAQVRDAE